MESASVFRNFEDFGTKAKSSSMIIIDYYDSCRGGWSNGSWLFFRRIISRYSPNVVELDVELFVEFELFAIDNLNRNRGTEMKEY